MPLTAQIRERFETYARTYTQNDFSWLNKIDVKQFQADFNEINTLEDGDLKIKLKVMSDVINLFNIIISNNVRFIIGPKDNFLLALQVLDHCKQIGKLPKIIRIECALVANDTIQKLLQNILTVTELYLELTNCNISSEFANILASARQRANQGSITLDDVTIDRRDLNLIDKSFNPPNVTAFTMTSAASGGKDTKSELPKPSAKPIAVAIKDKNITYRCDKSCNFEIKGTQSLTALTENLNYLVSMAPAGKAKKVTLADMKFDAEDSKCALQLLKDNDVAELTLVKVTIQNTAFIGSIFQHFPNLKSLTFNSCQFDEKCFASFSEKLKGNTKLAKLDLTGSILSEATLQDLRQVIHHEKCTVSSFVPPQVTTNANTLLAYWRVAQNSKSYTVCRNSDENINQQIDKLIAAYKASQHLLASQDPYYQNAGKELYGTLELHVVAQYAACLRERYAGREDSEETRASNLLKALPFAKQKQILFANRRSSGLLRALSTNPCSAELAKELITASIHIAKNETGNHPLSSANAAIPVVRDRCPESLQNKPELKDAVDDSFIEIAQSIYDKINTPKVLPLFHYQLPPSYIDRFKDFSKGHRHYEQAQTFLALHYRTLLLEHFATYLGVSISKHDVTGFADWEYTFHDFAERYALVLKSKNDAALFLHAVITDPKQPLTLQKLQTALNKYCTARDGVSNFFNVQILDLWHKAPSRENLKSAKKDIDAMVTLFSSSTNDTKQDSKLDSKLDAKTVGTYAATSAAMTLTAASQPVAQLQPSAPPLDSKDVKSAPVSKGKSTNPAATAAAITTQAISATAAPSKTVQPVAVPVAQSNTSAVASTATASVNTVEIIAPPGGLAAAATQSDAIQSTTTKKAAVPKKVLVCS